MGGLDGLETTRKLIRAIKWSSTLYTIVMGDEWVQTLKEEVEDRSGKLVDPKLERFYEVMQFSKKYNEELYVVRITFLSSL